MKPALALIYGHGLHGVKLTAEERAMAGWIFAAVFCLAIAAAYWTYISWKKKRSR